MPDPIPPARRPRVVAIASVAVVLVVALVAGVAAWRGRAADPVYSDDDAFARHLGPRAIAVPAGVSLPEVASGTPFLERPFDAPPTFAALLALADQHPPPDDTAEGISWAHTVITISKSELRVDLAGLSIPLPADPELGFEAKYKRDSRAGLYLVPLAQALQWATLHWKRLTPSTSTKPAKESVTVLADRDTPRRVLQELYFTCGQLEIAGVHFAALHEGHLVGVDHP